VPTVPPAPGESRTRTEIYDRLRAALERQPGVVSAAYAQHALLGGDLAMPFLTVPGQPRVDGEDRTVYSQAVTPNFFATTGIRLVSGRTFLESDRTRRVVVVNETLARRFFPAGAAIGRFVGQSKDAAAPDLPTAQLMEIVGIVSDAKYMTLREQTPPTIFEPFFQNPGEATFVVRAADVSAAMTDTVRRVARDATPSLAVVSFRTQEEQAALTYARESHVASIATLFAALALVLTSIGLYGLLSYTVAQRTREIGLRMALGAGRGAVVAALLREVGWLVAAGVTLGLAASAAAVRLVDSLLFGLEANDPATLAMVVATLAVIAGFAAALPARRAARVDPVIALRAE
jgi:predicted permease